MRLGDGSGGKEGLGQRVIFETKDCWEWVD